MESSGTTSAYYFDRQGAPISADVWAALWADMSYRVVVDDVVDNVQVRTVWEGIACSGRFFTGVGRDRGAFDTVAGAASEDEARQQHRRVLALVRSGAARTPECVA